VSVQLTGFAVVVTRPAHQSAPMVAALEALGARVIAFPAIRIEAVAFDAAHPAPEPDAHDWVIYTSANAVAQAVERCPSPRRARVAAVGPATARALADAGLPIAALPRSGADSQGLLALPEFAAPLGMRVLIMRGTGGRELLREELARRGATVTVAELYRRVAAAPTHKEHAALTQALAAPRPACVAVNSVDVLAALTDIIPADLVAALRSAPLVVPGTRVAAAARAAGWQGPVIEAAGAEDAAMIAAIRAYARRAGAAKGA